VRKLLRASAYHASGRADGRWVPAPDEDAFTIAATAVERAMRGHDPGGLPVGVDLLGEMPTSMEWAFSPLVGAPVRLHRSTGSARGLADALLRARTEAEGLSLVVAVNVPALPGPADAGDAEAVAFLFGDSAKEEPWDPETTGLEEHSAVDAARALSRQHRSGVHDPTWVGDWDRETGGSDPGASRPVSPLAERATEAVSQGAYVPRARYLENLPSRWRFVGEQCAGCGAVTFPARGRCRNCGKTQGLIPAGLPRDDLLVVATTVIGSGGQPTEFDLQVEALGPYEVVLAELAPGARVTLQLTDADAGEVRIGDRVDTRLRRLYPLEGEWRYGRKAVPARPTGARAPA
jgi:uncharacterized OB-fold protein